MVPSQDKYPQKQTFSINLKNLLRKHDKLCMHRYRYFRGFPWVHARISTLTLYTLDLCTQGKMYICSSPHVHCFSICYFLQCELVKRAEELVKRGWTVGDWRRKSQQWGQNCVCLIFLNKLSKWVIFSRFVSESSRAGKFNHITVA